MQHSHPFQALCADARTRVDEITPSEVAQLQQEGTCPLLIDVRETAEFQQSHIPNAIHLSRGIIEIHIDKFAAADTPIILYCGGGNRSLLSGDSLKKMGYTNVISMSGGFRQWHAEGHPTVSE